MEVLWAPKGRIWKDEAEAQEFCDLLMAYWNIINTLILDCVSPSAPPEETCIDVWEEDFAENDAQGLVLAMRDWCEGFTRATQQWPEAWTEALTRPDLAPHWELIRLFAQFEQPGNADRIEAMAGETPSRQLGPSVAALARALRQPMPE
jgi:hypothetical protein